MAHILIVEDDQVLNNAYKMILEREGHAVTSVTNGQEALDRVKEFKPDIILLDLLMPVLGGIEFLEQYDAKAHEETKIIVLSNMGDEKLVDRARELGAFKYIVKAHTSPAQLSLIINHLVKEKA